MASADERRPNTTHEFASAIVRTLAANQAKDGQLKDPLNGNRITLQEYAHTCYATAALRVAHRTSDRSLQVSAQRALEIYLSSDPRIRRSGEFDAFAIQELLDSEEVVPSQLEESLVNSIHFDASKRTGQGNNWLLLQALCRIRRGRAADRFIARKYLSLSERWEGPDGLLADQPRRPRQTRETPLTYHAKMAMCLVRLSTLGVDVSERAKSALATLARLSNSTGEFGYFGRSENTLFGYVSAIDAVIRHRETLDEIPIWFQQLEERLLWFLGRWFDPRTVNVQPTNDPAYSPVDGYVKRGVYGAYAAMLLSGLPEVSIPNSLPPTDEGGIQSVPSNEERLPCEPPFHHIRGNGLELRISTRGQVKWTNGGPDPRYAGGIPISLATNREPVFPGVPSNYTEKARLPFLPRIDDGQNSYVPVTWRPSDSTEHDYLAKGKFHPIPQKWIGSEMCDEGEGKLCVEKKEGDVTIVRRLLRHVASRTALERIVQDRRKQQCTTPFEIYRSIDVSTDNGFLVFQDYFVPRGNSIAATANIVPASPVVAPEFSDGVTFLASDEQTTISQRHGRAHWGDAVWMLPEHRRLSTELSTVLVVDVGNKVSSISFPTKSDDSIAGIHVKTVDGTFVYPGPII